jgi:hypothetical protein
VDYVLQSSSQTSFSLELLVLSTTWSWLYQCISVTDGLQTSLQGPPLGVGLVFLPPHTQLNWVASIICPCEVLSCL